MHLEPPPLFLELAKLPSFLCLLSRSELIHSLNKLPFGHLPACLIFLPEIKFGLIAFDLGLIVLIKRGPLDPYWPFSKWIAAGELDKNITKQKKKIQWKYKFGWNPRSMFKLIFYKVNHSYKSWGKLKHSHFSWFWIPSHSGWRFSQMTNL